MELDCPVKQYHWGKQGSSSLVAHLKRCADHNFLLNEDEMYAELWMGTHPSGPAFIKNTDISLDTFLQKNISILGDDTIKIFGENLPYLFKILSIKMPLSIQVHPSKIEAKNLHSKYPDIYKDPNHKPELAIAISNFEALCGFRPFKEIKIFFKLVPELRTIIGASKVDDFLNSNCDTESEQEDLMRDCFISLMHASDIEVKTQLDLFLQRMATEHQELRDMLLFDLMKKIHQHFPGDVGCFCIYFFNYLILKPGEAIFLNANQPHAYIFGDCVECMACSDNVVRAGLTPKFRDVDTLCRILNYAPGSVESILLHPLKEDDYSVLYKAPVQEFAVSKVEIKNGSSYELKPRTSSSILIVIEGCGRMADTELNEGQIFFLGAKESNVIEALSSFYERLLLFQAFVNV